MNLGPLQVSACLSLAVLLVTFLTWKALILIICLDLSSCALRPPSVIVFRHIALHSLLLRILHLLEICQIYPYEMSEVLYSYVLLLTFVGSAFPRRSNSAFSHPITLQLVRIAIHHLCRVCAALILLCLNLFMSPLLVHSLLSRSLRIWSFIPLVYLMKLFISSSAISPL